MNQDQLIDDLDIKSEGTTNYRKWSFKLLIYLFILNIILVVKILNSSGFFLSSKTEAIFFYTAALIDLLFVAGIILTLLSIVRKEKKDYRYWVSVIGYPLLILIFIYFNFISN